MSEVMGPQKFHGLLQLKLSPNYMSESTESQNHYPRTNLPPSVKIKVNASRGLKGSTTALRAKPHARKKFNNLEDGFKAKKELYLQNRAKLRQQVEEQSGENLKLLEELDVKECMLEIQSVILGKLAADENHLKGLVEVPEKVVVNFDERVKEVAEALTMLRY
jgi:predicted component of type VI protein secretion system